MTPYIRNLYEYLTLSAARLPEKTAFYDDALRLSFAALRDRSRALGTAVARAVGAPNRPVAVLTDRSAAAVSALMGVLAAGCFYVPLDRKTPDERLGATLGELSPALVVCVISSDAGRTPLAPYPVLTLENGLASVSDPDDALLEARREAVLDIDPAYMIYTSGSTGAPKGIPVSHRSVIDFTEWMAETCGVGEADVLANQAPFFFDLSVKDLYQTLKSGATTYILPQKCFAFPLLLTRALNREGVTALIWSTSAFRMTAVSGVLEKEPPTTVEKIILGGEALQAVHLNRWRRALPGCRFVNLYGPTEVTVDCTWFPVERDYRDDEPIPIGKACRNMEVLLLNDDLTPTPPGEIGEIAVRGTGLALGYWNDPEKTAAAFIPDPRNLAYPGRLYLTGDLARLDADGNLVFVARRDAQIKRAGYRIELGGIEAAVMATTGVGEAVCLFDEARDRIVCFYSGTPAEADLARRLGEVLPKYMLPSVYRPMKSLPHTPNGKLDRPSVRRLYDEEVAEHET